MEVAKKSKKAPRRLSKKRREAAAAALAKAKLSPKKPKIDFFLVGAAKCGTTSVYRTFSRHPDIYVPPIKEPRFMSGETLAKGWKWYAANWKKQPPGTITGDFSPSYSVNLRDNARAPKMIAKYYPRAKIIYIVRDPVAAAISNWRMATQTTAVTDHSFVEAFRTLPAVGDRMRYWSQISLYRKHFPDEQIRVVVAEDLTRNKKTLTNLFQWLGVRHEGPDIPKFAKANRTVTRTKRPPKPYIPVPDRIEVLSALRGEAEKILAYAGLPAKTWSLSKEAFAWLSDKEIEVERKRQIEFANIKKRKKAKQWSALRKMKRRLGMGSPPVWIARKTTQAVNSYPGRLVKRWLFVRIPRKLGKILRLRSAASASAPEK